MRMSGIEMLPVMPLGFCLFSNWRNSSTFLTKIFSKWLAKCVRQDTQLRYLSYWDTKVFGGFKWLGFWLRLTSKAPHFRRAWLSGMGPYLCQKMAGPEPKAGLKPALLRVIIGEPCIHSGHSLVKTWFKHHNKYEITPWNILGLFKQNKENLLEVYNALALNTKNWETQISSCWVLGFPVPSSLLKAKSVTSHNTIIVIK